MFAYKKFKGDLIVKIDDKTWEYVVATLKDSRKRNEVFDEFCRVVGTYDAPWGEAFWYSFDHLVDAMGKLVNDVEDSWLCYYIYDCDWGDKPMEVRIDGEVIMLDSWDKLRYILEA